MRLERLQSEIVAPNEGAHRIATFRWLLQEIVRPVVGATVVDLGAGHCKFARIAGEFGLAVTAVDVRRDRVPQDLGNIEFLESDVRTFDPAGYDLILILGLLYHLTLSDQIDLLARCPSSSTIIIDTQIHLPDLVVREANRAGFADEVVTDGPYSGVLFPEDNNVMASWGNARSFWHTAPSLLALLENSGRDWIRIVDPPYISKYGARSWVIAASTGADRKE